jgi:hypothetical protein
LGAKVSGVGEEAGMKALFLSLLTLASVSAVASPYLPYLDADFGCVSQADAQRYLSDFRVNVESFGGLELCDSKIDTKKLLNDISLIEKTDFAPDPDHFLIGNLVPLDQYYGWMKALTRGVERGNDRPTASAYNSGGHFTMQNGWAALSTLGRVGVVIHEARHTQGYGHIPCTHGPYAGSGSEGCDASVAAKGAHAVEVEYYTRVVLNAKNLHPVYQSMARLMAMGRANFVFNESPMKKREALAALSGNRLLLVDGERVKESEAPRAAPASRLKRTSFGASLVKGKEAVAVDLYSAASEPSKDDYSYYKLFQAPRSMEPKQARDIEEIDLAEQRFFAVLGEDKRISTYDFPGGGWRAPTEPLAGALAFVTRVPNGPSGLFVVKEDGSILPFDLKTRRLGSPLSERWRKDTLAYAMNGEKLVRLTSEGRVVDAVSGTSLPAFHDRTVTDLVNVPLYDAYEVVP